MSKLTKDQIEFAKAMTIKQRGVLNSLSMYDCYMSASEMADDELKEIIRHQLARYYAQPGIDGRLSWGATDAGRAVAQLIRRGSQVWRGSFPGMSDAQIKEAADLAGEMARAHEEVRGAGSRATRPRR